MLSVKQADGQPLSKGISIVDEKGNYIVTTVDDGHVFINDADQLSALYALDGDNNRLCRLITPWLISVTKMPSMKK